MILDTWMSQWTRKTLLIPLVGAGEMCNMKLKESINFDSKCTVSIVRGGG